MFYINAVCRVKDGSGNPTARHERGIATNSLTDFSSGTPKISLSIIDCELSIKIVHFDCYF